MNRAAGVGDQHGCGRRVSMRFVISSCAALALSAGAVVAPVLLPVGGPAATATGGAAMPFDFDGDGFADLAIGVPSEDLNHNRGASTGAVQVLYGSASGATARDQLWHQDRKGIKGRSRSGEGFGSTLASGDFDADGYADLAIGIPADKYAKLRSVGGVQVLYGGPSGLTTRDQLWHQDSPGVPGKDETGDRFGSALAAGDFDGDGFTDLAVGAPGEAVGDVAMAGGLFVLRGSAAGLTSGGARTWRQGKAGLPSQPRAGEAFGADLVAGDVTGDGRDDLIVEVRREQDYATEALDGIAAVHLLPGSGSGLTAAEDQFFGLPDLGIGNSDGIGGLSVSDFDADGRDDLAISVALRGVVALLHGRAGGFRIGPLSVGAAAGEDAALVIPYPLSPGNLASGDISGDGHADLAVQGERSITVVLGTAEGLGSSMGQWPVGYRWPGPLSVVPLSGVAHPWLVVGFPSEKVGTADGIGWHGLATVQQGTTDGEPGPAAVWHQDSPGIKGVAEPDDKFAAALP